MFAYDEWVKERGTDKYHPLDHTGYILTGIILVGLPPSGEIIGEFWYDSDNNMIQEPYDQPIQINKDLT